MTQLRLGAVLLLTIAVLTLSSCLLPIAKRPTQVVDLPSMLGKSLEEMTTRLGPSKPQGVCYRWDLPEGEISVCYESGDHAKKWMESIAYRLTPYGGFFENGEVETIEEMARIVNIDLEGKKPDGEIRGAYYYDRELNGRKVSLNFDGGPETIVGTRIHLK